MAQLVTLEDASGYKGEAEALFTPRNEEEVIELLRDASARGVPVTIAGAGTGVTGGCVPSGGWAVSLERFRRLEIHSGFAIAGAGVLLRDLQSAAAATGQFYPPDPTENAAAIGGTIATNASGSRSFRYGDTRRRVRRLRAALMDGRVIDVRRGDHIDFPAAAIPLPQTTKHSAGYRLAPGMDWIDLLAGSEGTLAVVMEAELELLPAPAALLAGVVFFHDNDASIDAVDAWRPVAGLRMLEYFDAGSLRLLAARYPEIPADAAAALLMEQEVDSPDTVEIDRWVDRLAAAQALSDESWFATNDSDRERFRRFRHALPEAVNDFIRRQGYTKLGSDYAVPLDRNREMLAFYRQVLEDLFPSRYVIFGHIGDAHVHVNILPASRAELERGRETMIEFARRAVALGGTVSAEHGLGKSKAHLLKLQYSPEHIEAMRAVKQRLDPLWLLGRGTLFAY